MSKFINNKLETKIDPNLKGEQKIHIFVIYNEITF